MKMLLPLAAALLALAAQAPALAQRSAAEQRALWSRPTPPFRIIGNVHYVGTAGIAAYLITGPRGHVLIDGVMAESADQIAANISRLGFRLRDVRVILINHAHWDHAGGLARLQRLTGARVVASAGDTLDLEHGFNADRDDIGHFPPVHVDRRIGDGDRVDLGSIHLVAHLTPGHTRGCTSWSTRVAQRRRAYDVLFAGSLTVAGENLVGNARYPDVVADFETSFARLRRLHADVFLTFHTNMFDFDGRRRRLARDPLAFVDAAELGRQVDAADAAFHTELARQQSASAGR